MQPESLVDSVAAGSRGRDLAHELRTPLAAIMALAEVMRDERLGPMGHAGYLGYASDVHGAARHALEIIDSVLGGGRQEESTSGDLAGVSGVATQPPLDFKDVDIGALVDGIGSALRPLVERAGVQLTVTHPGRKAAVIADPRCLVQIVSNLIHNALKFTPPGGAIDLNLVAAANGRLVLEVVDTGDGMAQGVVDRLMLGHRARASGRLGGTGIGIRIVSELVAANGALLSIESKAGIGTTVRVEFPAGRVVPL